MPQPITIQPQGGANSGTTVASIDASGNEVLNGTLTTGPVILTPVTAAPTAVPGALVLYTTDGVSLKFVGTGGQAGSQTIAGNLTVTGNLAVTGTSALTGKETIAGSSASGLLAITNAVATTTAAATITMTETAASNPTYGSAVAGDSNARYIVNADGGTKWGPGNAVTDMTLARGATGTLTLTTNTSPALTVTGATNGQQLLNPIGNDSTSVAMTTAVTGDANDRYRVLTTGLMTWGNGTASRDTQLSRSNPNELGVATANLRIVTAGRGFLVAEGSNAKQGTTTLVAGSSVVSNTSVTATSRIFLTSQVDGGTPGFLRVSTRTAGTSFTITSSNGADTSTVAYEIFEVG
jgi:hypothetical protein